MARALYSSGELTGVDVRELRQLLAAAEGSEPAGEEAGQAQPPRSRRGHRVLMAARRAVVGLLSLAVFAVTGVSWAGLRHLESRLNVTQALVDVPVVTGGQPNDGATDVLLVGSDSRTDANGDPLPLEVLKMLRTEESAGLNTDTLILIRVPHDGSRAVAISIPRDTYVPIPGYRQDKINTAYGASKRLATEQLRAAGITDRARLDREAAAGGQRALVQTVQELAGVEIDHYAEVNLYGFYLLTEAIGGVEVCLKRATEDSDSGADFRKGKQLISGGDALAFVRQRAHLPRGDLDRIVRQQVFMAALVRKTLAAGTLTDPNRLRALLNAVQQSVVLDAGWDALAFAQQLQGLAAGAVEFVTIPVVDVAARNERGQSIVTVDQAAVRAFVGRVVDGRPPPVATPPRPSVATSTPQPVMIEVSNGTRHAGLAGRVLDVLVGSGLPPGSTVNAALRQRTEVRVAPADRAVGERIAAALGGLPMATDGKLPAGRAEVMLGADYAGPGLRSVTSSPAPPPRTATGVPVDEDVPITADGIPCVD